MTLSPYGVWAAASDLSGETAAELEALGYGAVWIGASPPADLELAEELLAATSSLVVATGIVNIWSAPAPEVAASYHRIADRFGTRFLLGVGAGHPEATAQYEKPYEALVRYLDALDAASVPAASVVLAALGPKVLRLARDRTAGAHPYLVPASYTAGARTTLGPDALLAPEHKVALLDDPAAARELGRSRVANPYLGLTNYVSNLHRLGYSDADVEPPGSDRLIDDVVAHGSPAAAAAAVRAHLEAGADHVCVQPLPRTPSEGILPTLRELAPALVTS